MNEESFGNYFNNKFFFSYPGTFNGKSKDKLSNPIRMVHRPKNGINREPADSKLDH